MSRIREGFELVRLKRLETLNFRRIDDGKHAGVVAVGGLLLAKIPNETRDERNAYFKTVLNSNKMLVDND